MDDESDESIKQEVSVVVTGDRNLADWYEVDEQKLGVVSRDELKHAERKPAVVAALVARRRRRAVGRATVAFIA